MDDPVRRRVVIGDQVGSEGCNDRLAFWALVTLGLGLVGIVQLVRIPICRVVRLRGRNSIEWARNIGTVILAYTIAEGISARALHALQLDALIIPNAVGIAGGG